MRRGRGRRRVLLSTRFSRRSLSRSTCAVTGFPSLSDVSVQFRTVALALVLDAVEVD